MKKLKKLTCECERVFIVELSPAAAIVETRTCKVLNRMRIGMTWGEHRRAQAKYKYTIEDL